jgi:PleD family two-component response regulator
MRAHRPATSLLVRRLQLKRGVGKSSSSSSVSSLERESEATVGGGKSTTPAVTPTLKILAFEDSYDIRDMLRDGDVEVEGTTVFSQRWTSENCLEVIKEFDPDVLLLDYYMPPFTGLAVLKMVNEEVKAGRLRRPRRIVGMSSESSCNASMLREGADDACVKWDISSWNGWENR